MPAASTPVGKPQSNYQMRSSFGAQPVSHRRKAPAFGFGTATREGVGSVKASPRRGQGQDTGGFESPRSVTNSLGQGQAKDEMPKALGKQAQSNKASSPRFSFGLSGRFGGFGGDSPRTLQGSTSPRVAPMSHFYGPGPGAYANPPAMGKQIETRFRSPQGVSFGTADREQMARVYISKTHERLQLGRTSPGPSLSPRSSAFGSQPEACRPTTPSFGMGTTHRGTVAERHALREAAKSPGPQTYYVTMSSGLHPVPKFENAPKVSMLGSSRSLAGKVFVSERNALLSAGRVSPGPAGYAPTDSGVGRQLLSKRPSSPAHVFGSGPRFGMYEKTTSDKRPSPGPGYYNV
mmetsp:Transcript_21837/g.55417  ORF Transcript_21837/g.55417 Transcript_21837/m.55417 type:complete len:348 (-) Transcript_21837:425-1468(-)